MAYKKWLQVKIKGAREMCLEAKKEAIQVVRKAKMRNELSIARLQNRKTPGYVK